MPLQRAPVEISLASGINTKWAEKMLPPGAMAECENGFFDKNGEVKKLRPGSAVGTTYSGGALNSGELDGAFEHNGVVHLEGMWEADTDGEFKRATGYYDPDNDRQEFVGYDREYDTRWAPGCRVTTRRYGPPTDQALLATCASVGGYTVRIGVTEYNAGAVTRVTVVEDATGRLVLDTTTTASKVLPIVFDTSGAEKIGYAYFSGSSFSWELYHTADGSSSTASATINNCSATLWDIASRADTNRVDIYYHETTANEIYHAAVASDGTISEAAASLHAEQPTSILSVARSRSSSTQYHVLTWQSNSSSRPRYAVQVANSTTAVSTSSGARDASTDTVGIARITGAIEGDSLNWVQIFIEHESSQLYIECVRHVESSGASDDPAPKIYNVSIAAKAFDSGYAVYLPVSSWMATRETYYVLGQGDHQVTGATAIEWTVVANALRTRAQRPAAANIISDIADYGDGKYGFAGGRQARLVSDGAILNQPVEVIFELYGRAKRTARLGPEAVIRTGAVTSVFTSGYRPMGLEPVDEFSGAEAASGSIAAGTYHYKLVAEYQTEDGRLWRSGPSTAQSVTVTGGSKKVTITAYPSPVAADRRTYPIRIYVYRTVDAGGASGTYYNTGAYMDWDYSGALTCDDTIADSSLTDNELLYTTGGVLENVPPPPSESIAVGNNRVWVIASDDPQSLWASKEIVDNVGVEFAAELVKPLSLETVPKAIEYMDGRIYVFCEESVWSLPATAPNSLGQGAFGSVSEVARGVGCVDSNAIRRVSDGIVFQSNSGLQFLDRSGQVVPYFGAPVDDYKSDNILKIEEPTDRDEIWFLTDESRFLIYNTYFRKWSYSIALSDYGNGGFPVDIAFTGTQYVAPDPTAGGSYVLVQEASLWTGQDLTVTTPWLRIGAVHQMQRIWRAAILGEFRSRTVLTIDVYVDWDDTTSVQTETVTLGPGYSVGDVVEARIHLVRQKCRAMRFKIAESPTNSSFEGVSLSSLTLIAGVKKGFKTVSVSR